MAGIKVIRPPPCAAPETPRVAMPAGETPRARPGGRIGVLANLCVVNFGNDLHDFRGREDGPVWGGLNGTTGRIWQEDDWQEDSGETRVSS